MRTRPPSCPRGAPLCSETTEGAAASIPGSPGGHIWVRGQPWPNVREAGVPVPNAMTQRPMTESLLPGLHPPSPSQALNPELLGPTWGSLSLPNWSPSSCSISPAWPPTLHHRPHRSLPPPGSLLPCVLDPHPWHCEPPSCCQPTCPLQAALITCRPGPAPCSLGTSLGANVALSPSVPSPLSGGQMPPQVGPLSGSPRSQNGVRSCRTQPFWSGLCPS